MFYDFPVGLSLEEVRRVIKNHNERLGAVSFIEANRGDHVIFNYIVAFADSFPQPDTDDVALNREYAILRECRGLVFHKDGRLLARRYHKFFNVNEKSFTQSHLIDWTRPHVILEKLDGSMITPYWRDDGMTIGWATKMGFTDVAKPVEEFVAAHPEYLNAAHFLLGSGFTPIFEWCSRKQKIVVDYQTDRLVLTAIRENSSGKYSTFDKMKAIADVFHLDLVKMIEGLPAQIDESLEQIYAMEGEEGVIFRFDNGHMLKGKGRWYSQIHRTKDNLQREKDVWQMILDENVDDLRPFMDDVDRDRVDRFITAFEEKVANRARGLTALVAAGKAVKDDKKFFATEFLRGADPLSRSLAFAIWDGHSATEVVLEYLKKNYHTQTKIDGVRAFVEGLKWEDFRDNQIDLGD